MPSSIATNEKLNVKGMLNISLDPFIVSGTLTVTCGSAKKIVGLTFKDGCVYLALYADAEEEGPIKISVKAAQAIEIVRKFLPKNVTLDRVIEAIFEIGFSGFIPELAEISKEDGSAATYLEMKIAITGSSKSSRCNSNSVSISPSACITAMTTAG